MAETIPIVLFFLSKREYSVDSIIFDLVIEESHNMESTVTQFNVEDGSNVNDHIKNELRKGSLVGKVTNFSLNDSSFVGNKVIEAWESFKSLRDEKKKVTIACIMEVYDSVVVTSVGTIRNRDTGEAGEFSVSFQQINIVKLSQLSVEATVNLSSSGSSTNKQSMKQLDKGKIITAGA